MHVQSLGWRTDLALLEASGSSVEDRGDHLVVRTPDNPTFWWGNFILVDHIPPAGEHGQWIKVFQKSFPGAEHVAIGFDAVAGERSDLSCFADRGFETQADAVMTAEGVPLARPAKAEADLRALCTDEDWRQSLELRLRVNERVGDVGYTEFGAARVAAYRRMAEAGAGAWFGAFIDGRLAAQLGLFHIGEGMARYQSVETDPADRRHGLAGALVHHAGAWGLANLPVRQLVMVADPDYFAIDLYRQLGFGVSETQVRAQCFPVPH